MRWKEEQLQEGVTRQVSTVCVVCAFMRMRYAIHGAYVYVLYNATISRTHVCNIPVKVVVGFELSKRCYVERERSCSCVCVVISDGSRKGTEGDCVREERGAP